MDTDGQGPTGSAWSGWPAVAVYVLAGLLYVGLGVFIPELLFSWWEGVPFLLLFVWITHRVRQRLA